jgi:hypothetical protein
MSTKKQWMQGAALAMSLTTLSSCRDAVLLGHASLLL